MSNKQKRPIPIFNHPIIETHCHLDYLDAEALHEVLLKSKMNGIEKIITIAVSPDNLQKVLSLTQQHDFIFGSQDVHPHDAAKLTNDCFTEIKNNLSQQKILAVGEIGLD